MAKSENVMVFPAALLDEVGYPAKFSREAYRYYDRILSEGPWFLERDKAEDDPTWKQIIPYNVFYDSSDNTYLVYQRSKKGGEGRLYGKWSMGIGGHLNDEDNGAGCQANSMYDFGRIREITEETNAEKTMGISIAWNSPTAVIYDDSSDVGRVHFGFVHIYGVDKRLKITDPNMVNEDWLTPDALREKVADFENWSQILIENLFN